MLASEVDQRQNPGAACCLAESPSYILAGSDPEESLDPEFPPYGLCTCRWVYSDVMTLCVRLEGLGLEHFPSLTMSFLVFLHFTCQTEGPEFSCSLEHVKNLIKVHMPFHNGCVHFTLPQTNTENSVGLRCSWERCLVSGRFDHMSPFVVAVLQIQTFTRSVYGQT